MQSGRALDIKKLEPAIAAMPALRHQDILIYDGDCRFCQAQAARLGRWAGPTLVLQPLQQPGLLGALGIEHAEAMSAMQLVTAWEDPKKPGEHGGRIYRG